MKPLQLIFIGFLAIPFVEIYFLLQMGSIIGALATIFLVVFTAILGAFLLKSQGLATWQRVQENLRRGQFPASEMIEGPILLVGGALLLTPGFFTDIIGFACLLPITRTAIARYILAQNINKQAPFNNAAKESDVLEGEFKQED